MTTVAVIGAGAIGATAAAWLIAGGDIDVTLCVRTPFDRLRVETPHGVLESSPAILTDPVQASAVDWVLVCTKTYDSPGAAAWLTRLCGERTHVAVLQNGVEHRDRFPAIPAEHFVPTIVDMPAERDSPGRVRQRRDGSMIVPASEAGQAFAALFAHSPIAISLTDDWLTAAWRKLAVNCAGAVNALSLQPAGIAWDEDVADVMRGLVHECIAVGRAEGAHLPDAIADEVVARYRAQPADAMNSIQADRQNGRRTEADARNGVIVRRGEAHDIPAPLNHMADALIRAATLA